MITLIIFLLVLSVLVLVHELGHFLIARLFKIRVEEFGLGFPPRALGYYKNKFGKRVKLVGSKDFEELSTSEDENLQPKKGSTIFSLNYLPLGGFVKIKGENGQNRNEPDSFGAKPIWQRAGVLVAGVIMNVILAWFLFSIGYLIGLPQTTDELGSKAIVSEQAVLVADVLSDSPAAEAGILVGDRITMVAQEKVLNEKQLQDAVSTRADQETEFLVLRDDKEIKLNIVPSSNLNEGRAVIGISIFSTGTVRYPFFSALYEGAKTAAWTLKAIFLAFIGLFKDLFTGVSVGDQFAGPIGIANITGQAARLGFVYLLQFAALLSLNLAIINILPFPALDGGRLMFLLVEKIKGAPVKKEIENLLNNIGFILLMILIIFITVKDVIKLF
ncbi:MAG: RIP metalloprotease RseP [Bacteroidales bacterium]|nr:RIP metalloprotease RseP [Bacteroidales bacterium]